MELKPNGVEVIIVMWCGVCTKSLLPNKIARCQLLVTYIGVLIYENSTTVRKQEKYQTKIHLVSVIRVSKTT